MTQSVHETLKPWAIARVTYENDLFVHENMGAYFTEQGALKKYTLLQGKVWKGKSEKYVLSSFRDLEQRTRYKHS